MSGDWYAIIYSVVLRSRLLNPFYFAVAEEGTGEGMEFAQ